MSQSNQFTDLQILQNHSKYLKKNLKNYSSYLKIMNNFGKNPNIHFFRCSKRDFGIYFFSKS